jgi:hypothetical protein
MHGAEWVRVKLSVALALVHDSHCHGGVQLIARHQTGPLQPIS